MRPLAVAALGLAIGVTAFGLGVGQGAAPDPDEWATYVRRFVTMDGRVVDTGNRGISHSEGQGYAMLLAVANRDPETFAELWRWTRRHLQIRGDHLFAWKWDPAAPDPVADRNSAADGDILIAWALARAARLWGDPGHREAARAIAHDVLAQLVIQDGDHTLLLPGPQGFVHGDVVTVNPSYWVFPAFAELDGMAPSPLWAALTASGLELIERARFGPQRLPPDWLALDESLRPSPLFPPTFGYDAIRVPLHLVWAGIADERLLRPFVDWAGAAGGRPPATVDLLTGEVSPEAASGGARAVLDLARSALDGDPPALPRLGDDADYFAASLLLLSKLAHAERSAP